MNSNTLRLDYVINASNFQNIQDSISEATDMAMLTVDFRGTPVTSHSKCTQLCKRIREHPQYSEVCERCDSRGGLEATRLGQPYIYLCHMGIIDFAVPVTINGQYLGAVMAGQVLLEKESEKELLEQIVSEKPNVLSIFDVNELSELYRQLPVMKLDKIKAIATMIYNLSNYIVEEAVLKINLNEKHEHIPKDCNHKQNDKLPNINIGFDVKSDNILLKPALDYIKKNYSKAITLDGMAVICNISPSYFSKLFKRDIGDSFTNYINKIRVQKAKELLENSKESITNISLDVGFEECGYFIKVFKRFERVTPAVYRNGINTFKSN